MKLKVQVISRMRTEEFQRAMDRAVKQALKDVVIDIANESIKKSPYDTGNNRRSISFNTGSQAAKTAESKGTSWDFKRRIGTSKSFRTVKTVSVGRFEGLTSLQGAVFSTSGYGGFLETGTRRMKARPYMNPAREHHFTEKRMADEINKHLQKGF